MVNDQNPAIRYADDLKRYLANGARPGDKPRFEDYGIGESTATMIETVTRGERREP